MGKRVLAVVLMIIILIGVSGCMNKKKKWTPQLIQNEARVNLKKKYGEEFVVVFVSSEGWGQGYDFLMAYPKDGKIEDQFGIWFSRNDDGTYHQSDGYFQYIIRDEVEAVMSGFVQEIYKDFKLYMECSKTSTRPDSLTKDTKLREIQDKLGKDEYFSSDVIVFVKQSSAEGIDIKESLRKIAQKMIENKAVGAVCLFIVVDNKYEDVNRDTLNIGDADEYFVGDYTRISVNSKYEVRESGGNK